MQIPTANIDTFVVALPAPIYKLLQSLAAEGSRSPQKHAAILLQGAILQEDARRKQIEAAKPVGLADCWKGAES